MNATALLDQELALPSPSGSYLLEGHASANVAGQLIERLQNLYCEGLLKPCQQCRQCERLGKKQHPDLAWLAPVKGVISIEATREALRHLQHPPLEGKLRLVVFDQAECLNPFAANALLKSLEEPPPQTMIFLITTRSNHLLATLLSRLRRIHFAPLPPTEQARRFGVNSDQAMLLSWAPDPTAMAEWLEQAPSLWQSLQTWLRSDSVKPETRLQALWRMGNDLLASDERIHERATLLVTLLRDLTYLKCGLPSTLLLHRQLEPDYHSTIAHRSQDELYTLLQAGYQFVQQLDKHNANRKISVEALLAVFEGQP